MAKAQGKRGYHKQDMKNVNRVALLIGGAAAVAILVIMAVSFLT